MASSLQAVRLCEVLLEQGPGCVWVCRRDAIIECAYGNAVALFGVPAGELAGRSLLGVVRPERRPLWQERLARVFAGDTLTLDEPGASGRFSIACYPLRLDGAVDYAAAAASGGAGWHDPACQARGMALELLKSADRDRTRMARLLHDELGQSLSAAGLQLDLLRMDLEDAAPTLPARTAEIQQLLERAMERVREFSRTLEPDVVGPAGLYAALDRLAGRTRRSFRGRFRLMADSSLRLDAAPARALYRIAEQAVDNAVRHGRSTTLEVQLKSTSQGPTLEVRDNGVGFDAGRGVPPGSGLGLLIMEHYAAEAGIDLAITSRPGSGTVVRAVLRARIPDAPEAPYE